MAPFAYVLLPVTGLIAYLTGRDERVRTHGLQAIVIGLLWPLALYAAAFGPPTAVQVVFGAGAFVWVVFFLATLLGRDPRLPVVGSFVAGAARGGTKDGP